MGCGLSNHRIKFHAKVHLSEDNFTLHQRCLVLRTWRYLADDKLDNGIRVFSRIIEVFPHVKQLFPFRNVPDEKLADNPVFTGHALRFMTAVGSVMENIEDPDAKLTDVLLGLGKRHISFKGFAVDYFNAFVSSFMFVWEDQLGSKFQGETKEAWAIVFNFVKVKMTEGYQLGILEQEAKEKLARKAKVKAQKVIK